MTKYLKYESPDTPIYKIKKWTGEHVQQKQYLLQGAKCLDSGSCDTDELDIIDEYRVLLGWPVFNIAEDDWTILFESFQIYFFG